MICYDEQTVDVVTEPTSVRKSEREGTGSPASTTTLPATVSPEKNHTGEAGLTATESRGDGRMVRVCERVKV